MNRKLIIIGVVLLILTSLTLFPFIVYKQFNKSDQENNIADDTIQINDDQEQNISNQSCTVDGVEYLDGESFPSPDSCNTCTCDNGIVSCTERSCLTEFSKKIDVYYMDGSGLSHSFNIRGQVPSTSIIEDKSNYSYLINKDSAVLSISFNGDDVSSRIASINKFKTVIIQNEKIENLRRIDDTPNYFNESSNLYPLKNKWYIYSDSYKESDCKNQYDTEDYVSCYNPIVQAKQINGDWREWLDIYCGVNDETDVEQCDQIMETLYVERVE